MALRHLVIIVNITPYIDNCISNFKKRYTANLSTYHVSVFAATLERYKPWILVISSANSAARNLDINLGLKTLD